jgi:uncharacterized protein (TIGR02246 family)
MNASTPEQQVRAVMDRWVQAACAKDVDRIMDCYAPDVRAFDAVTALQFQGAEAYRRHWEYCMGFVEGDMLFEIHDQHIAVADDVAFTHFLASCGCTDKDGNDQVGWIRGTVCLRRMDGEWRIVHEHYSMPFDPETMKVLDDPQP